MTDPNYDKAYLLLKGAREKLCLAQMEVPAAAASDLERAIQRIDSVGSRTCPAWSRHDRTHEVRGRAEEDTEDALWCGRGDCSKWSIGIQCNHEPVPFVTP